ncbi:hypothetical protein L917_14293 [Phytophthora nicotianae]|uniref:Uncharacterized protein n=1 Tax=Phytophthora nicotianae TaxID=4792 RepID=W2KNV3_PHYNI|nr:hypothetical protein L917_14293 [Phytophthora nicotianae]
MIQRKQATLLEELLDYVCQTACTSGPFDLGTDL